MESLKNNRQTFFLEILEIRPLSAIACQFYQNALDINKNRFLCLEIPKYVHILFNRIYNKTKVELTEKCILTLLQQAASFCR